MNILIAPNAFKESLSAEEAARAICKGLEQSALKCECVCFPVGDGGDGTGELIIKKLAGYHIETEVHDPLGRLIKSSFGLVDNGNTAVIEMASASGIHLLKREELNPLAATCFGSGEQIIAALELGVKKIIIGMGGSATVDGGYGILKALGVRFQDNEKNEITSDMPVSLNRLESINISAIDTRIFDCEVVVLCDVNNPLLGEAGAAAVFGPQKGAIAEDIPVLDAALSRYSDIVLKQTQKNIGTIKHGGSAGGAAAGLYGIVNAELVSGIEYFLDLTNFDEPLSNADLVITGEGSVDEQTLQGKAPFGVAERAKKMGLPVIAFAGSVPIHSSPGMYNYFDSLIPINNTLTDLQSALKSTAINLSRTANDIGNLLSLHFER